MQKCLYCEVCCQVNCLQTCERMSAYWAIKVCVFVKFHIQWSRTSITGCRLYPHAVFIPRAHAIQLMPTVSAFSSLCDGDGREKSVVLSLQSKSYPGPLEDTRNQCKICTGYNATWQIQLFQLRPGSVETGYTKAPLGDGVILTQVGRSYIVSQMSCYIMQNISPL